MDEEIHMTKEAHKTLKYIMSNTKELTDDNEIAAWLLGRWEFTKDKIIAHVEEIHIPKQDVSGAEVDINEESQLETSKIIEESNKELIGHWHIHPFDKGEPNWSGTDETKIKEIMHERKNFLFMLSSQVTLYGRIELRPSINLGEETYEFTHKEDDIKPIVPTESWEGEEALKAVIKEKVTEKKSAYVKSTYNKINYIQDATSLEHFNIDTRGKISYRSGEEDQLPPHVQKKIAEKMDDKKPFTIYREGKDLYLIAEKDFDYFGDMARVMLACIDRKGHVEENNSNENMYVYMELTGRKSENNKGIKKLYDELLGLAMEYNITQEKSNEQYTNYNYVGSGYY